MKPMEVIPARTARRLLLSLQALNLPRPCSTPAAASAMVARLGYVQIDSINVIDRAHHLILAARLDDYLPAHLAHGLERSRRLFEHWTHDACAIPTAWYPHWHHRFRRFESRHRTQAWWRERFGRDAAGVLRSVLARVRREGPLRARDFLPKDAPRREQGGWWNWHAEKAALEILWRSGRLAITRRERFEKVYDLPDRVHPRAHALRATDSASHLDWACREALARLGVATEREIAAFFAAVTVAEVRAWARQAMARGEIERVSVEPEGGGRPVPCVAPAEWRHLVRNPRAVAGMSRAKSPAPSEIIPLAPFDPLVRDRARLLRLFGFDFRFEAFTPTAKRRYGYYCMPLLEGDRLVGRIDPKFDRESGVLEVRGPWWEPGVRPDRARFRRLEIGLLRLARRIGAEQVRIERQSSAAASTTRPAKARASGAASGGRSRRSRASMV